jgi:hypothetical protein
VASNTARPTIEHRIRRTGRFARLLFVMGVIRVIRGEIYFCFSSQSSKRERRAQQIL